jgi:hypothetical protein
MNRGGKAMKRIILVTVVAFVLAGLAGCNTCRRMTGGWFNRGDRCEVYPPANYAPGVPQATMMMPGTTMMPGGPQVLPGPIEIGPVN